MDVLLKRQVTRILLLLSLLPNSNALLATAYVYPGNNPPLTMSTDSADTLSVNSGTMQNTNSTDAFSVSIGGTSGVAGSASVTVANGASLGYAGTSLIAGNTIKSTRDTNGVVSIVINNNGTIDSGNGSVALYFTNATDPNNDTITFNHGSANTASIIGNIFVSNSNSITLNIDNDSTISGAVQMTPGTGGTSTINIGQNAATTFSTEGELINISDLSVKNNSTFNLNDQATALKAMTVDADSTANINAAITVATADGAITNNGTMNISASITKTGAFTTGAAGNTKILQAVTFATTDYSNSGTHTAVMQDVLNYGSLTLSSDTPAALANFVVTHTGGYFPAGAYTLLDANAAIVPNPNFTQPSNTNFITFSNLQKSSDKIQITLTRNGYQNQASSSLTKQIGANLETIGAGSNPSSNLVAILNAVEASPNATELEHNLRQLGPLTSGPIYGLTVQNESITQVTLRLAELRNQSRYMAGDLLHENHLWLRPFGSYADQQAKRDSYGYTANSAGLAIGFDREIDTHYTMGIAASFAFSRVNDKINAGSSVSMKTYQGMLYGTYNFDASRYMDWIIAASANNFNNYRRLTLPGLSQAATSQGYSQQVAFKGVWGKNFSAFDFLQLTPEAYAQYTFGQQYEYTEENASGANLVINRPNSNIIQLGIGAKMSTPMQTDRSIIIPEVHGSFGYNIIAGEQDTLFAFTAGGSQMTSNIALNRMALTLGAALTFAISDRVQVKLNADYEIQDRYKGCSAYLDFKYLL